MKTASVCLALAMCGPFHTPSFSQETTALEARILIAQYDARTQADVFGPYQKDLDELNAKFAAALEREQLAVQKAGNLEAALTLKAEKEAVLKGGYDVPADDDKTLAILKKMRGSYRLALIQLQLARDRKLAPLNNTAVSALQRLISTFTKDGRLDDAVAAKALLEKIQAGTGLPLAEGAGPAGSWTSKLGMKFVPVPGTSILMCIHETRNADYLAYAKSERNLSETWKNMAISMSSKPDDDKPVSGVSYLEATAFCQWLSKKEGRTFRLPTDLEWSAAVGIAEQEKKMGTTIPERLSRRVDDVYPWGGLFPPKGGEPCGNYADATLNVSQAMPFIAGYSDGHPYTAPVMSYKPNNLGIYDLGGNVSEWVEDWYNETQTERALRGGGWNARAGDMLLSSTRTHRTPDDRGNNHGFRVVVEKEP